MTLNLKAAIESISQPFHPVSMPSKTTIHALPKNILENVCNYLPIEHVAQNVHFVCKNWQYLKQANKHLLLRELKINTVGVTQLLYEYKDRTLDSLDLIKCKNLVNVTLNLVAQFPSLTALELSGLPTDDQGSAHFSKKMPSNPSAFSHLYIRSSRITESSVSLTAQQMGQLSLLPLKKLYLDSNTIDSEGLKNLPLSLTHLSLSGCKGLSPNSFQPLASLVSLTYLDVSFTPVTDDSLFPLSELSIRLLNLAACGAITDKGLNYLKPTLEGLNVFGCSTITNRGMAILAKHPLRYLKLDHCPLISDAGIEFLSQAPLRQLIVRHCPLLTDKAVSITSTMHLIERCFLGCKGITDPNKHSIWPDEVHMPRNYLYEQR